MAEIIDFPAQRIQRLVLLRQLWLDAGQQITVVEYFLDLTRQYGFSARDAAKEALEAAR